MLKEPRGRVSSARIFYGSILHCRASKCATDRDHLVTLGLHWVEVVTRVLVPDSWKNALTDKEKVSLPLLDLELAILGLYGFGSIQACEPRYLLKEERGNICRFGR